MTGRYENISTLKPRIGDILIFRYPNQTNLEITRIIKMTPERVWRSTSALGIWDILDLCGRFETIEEAMLFIESAGLNFGNRTIEVNFAPCYKKFYETRKILPFNGDKVPGCGFFGWRRLN